MKKTAPGLVIALLTAMLFPFSAHALDAGVTYAVYSAAGKPYIEVNIEIADASMMYKRIDSVHMQSSVEVMILLNQGDRVAAYEKYVLMSPLLRHPQSLLDVKRLALAPGDYELEVVCTDLNAKADSQDVFRAPVRVEIGSTIYLTEARLLRGYRRDTSAGPFTRNGFYLEPLPFNYYDRDATVMAFYAEIYNSSASIAAPSYLLRYTVEEEKGNGVRQVVTVGNQRRKPAPVEAVLAQIDISKVPSGNYTLTLELRNDANELLASRKVAFQRSNPYLNVAESDLTDEVVEKQFVQGLEEPALRYSLRAIAALASGPDAEMLSNMLKGSDLKAMRFYLFRHFIREDHNNPERAFRDYMVVANAVDNKFHSGFRYGFETDRGRIFLKYGKPDDQVRVDEEADAPPYEIWVYYKFPKTNQSNVKFLFYDPNLSGEFQLLHSTARGEINNPRWERDLYKRATQQFEGNNFNDATSVSRFGSRNAKAYFEDF
jgi:GWxTD domain-containing protein